MYIYIPGLEENWLGRQELKLVAISHVNDKALRLVAATEVRAADDG